MSSVSLASRATDWAAPLARIFFAAIFLMSGVSKLTNMAGAATLMTSKGLPLVDLLLVLTIAIEIAAALAIAIGYRTRLAALLLFLWMVPVTLVFHAFWAVEAAQFATQRTQFLKNLAIMGGALMLVIHGAGAFSLDRRRGT